MDLVKPELAVTNAKAMQRFEIHIPFQAAQSAYSKELADIVSNINNSQANEAKKHNISEFDFYLIYNQVEDPDVESEQEFVDKVLKQTSVALRCRGFKFKSSVPLDYIPQNIVNRIQERAKLICQSRRTSKKATPYFGDSKFAPNEPSLNSEVEELCGQIQAFVQKHNLDVRFGHLAKQALLQYKTE